MLLSVSPQGHTQPRQEPLEVHQDFSCPWEGTMPDWHMHQAAQLVSSQGKATMLPLCTDLPPAGSDPAPVLVFLLCLERAYLCQMDAKQLKGLCLYTLERKRLKSDFTAL